MIYYLLINKLSKKYNNKILIALIALSILLILVYFINKYLPQFNNNKYTKYIKYYAFIAILEFILVVVNHNSTTKPKKKPIKYSNQYTHYPYNPYIHYQLPQIQQQTKPPHIQQPIVSSQIKPLVHLETPNNDSTGVAKKQEIINEQNKEDKKEENHSMDVKTYVPPSEGDIKKDDDTIPVYAD